MAAALGLALLAGRGQAQVSPPSSLFVPGDRVPLSAFAPSSDFPTRTVVLHVEPEILQWLVAGASAVEIAHHDGVSVSFLAPTSVDPNGTVILDSAPDGNFTVVSSALVNDLPIVTHWDATKNEYYDPYSSPQPILVQRGGQSVGGTDGIHLIELDLASGDLGVKGSALSSNPLHAHPTHGRYHYATYAYAVFSDGTELTSAKDGEPADADVPDYERYVGENFAIASISDLAAIWLSDQSRAGSGFPIAHRNAPEAFDFAGPANEHLYTDAPIFQIAHCHIVDIGDLYPLIPGSENSLATFVLPPGWTPTPQVEYPVLFTGFYDIHNSTFGEVGLQYLDILGELYTTSTRRAVGVLWNGGGAGAQTMHRSAYDNAAVLIDDTELLVAGDRHRIVMTGGSRGGTTALAMAANPFYPGDYTVQFALADNPQLRQGEAVDYYCNPTYKLVQEVLAIAAGYTGAWQQDWVDPVTFRSGKKQGQYVLTGSTDSAYLDANMVNDSPPFIAGLVANGTKVVLRAGTHDFSRAHRVTVEYVDRLRDAGVTVHFDILYRFGHAHTFRPEPTEVTLLNKVFDYNHSLLNVDEHYKRDPLDYTAGVQFFPDHIPALLEAPLVTGMAQEHTYDIVGPPDADYEVWAQKIVSPNDVQTFPFVLFSGTLSSATGATFGTATHSIAYYALPNPAFESSYRVELRYRLSGAPTWEPSIGSGAFAPPTYDEPVVWLFPEEKIGWTVESRTGGVSGDVNF